MMWSRSGLIFWIDRTGSSLGRDTFHTVLCSWASRFTLAVPLPTQVCKPVPANLMLV